MERKSDRSYKTEEEIFAKRLKEIMKKRGLSQTQLQAKIKEQFGKTLQRQTISLYMLGQSKPDTERLTLLCRTLNVSADYLLGLSDVVSVDPEIGAICEYTGLSAECIDLLHIDSLVLDPPGHNDFNTRLITEILLDGDLTDNVLSYITFSSDALVMAACSKGDDKRAFIHNTMHTLQGKDWFVLDGRTAAAFYLSKAGERLSRKICSVLKSMRDNRFAWMMEAQGNAPIEEFDWSFVQNEEADHGEHQED